MVVEPPDTGDLSFSHLDDPSEQGMPERTRRAFQSHYDAQLQPSGRVEDTIGEIERVYRMDAESVVALSGGKDSMATLALAAASDATHRAFHWDWGSRLIPREIEREVVTNTRQYVPDERLYVAARAHSTVKPYAYHAAFKRGLREADGITDTDGSLSRMVGVLARTDALGRQIVGLRAGESGKRDRKLAESGLHGESLGQPASFPLREWSARDVWAYLVAEGVPYPDHYDRLAQSAGEGSPEDYEQARFTTFFDPEFEELSGAAMGVAEWRNRHVE